MNYAEAREQLCTPIRGIGWQMSYTDTQQKTAELALQELLSRLNERRITKHIPFRQQTYEYLLNLYEAEKALEHCDFCFACNELLNVIYLYCSAQVIAVVRDMLEKHFREGAHEKAVLENTE